MKQYQNKLQKLPPDSTSSSQQQQMKSKPRQRHIQTDDITYQESFSHRMQPQTAHNLNDYTKNYNDKNYNNQPDDTPKGKLHRSLSKKSVRFATQQDDAEEEDIESITQPRQQEPIPQQLPLPYYQQQQEQNFVSQESYESKPLIILDIDIRQGQTAQLKIYEDSDPQLLANSFVKTNGLNDKLVDPISKSIQQQLKICAEKTQKQKSQQSANQSKQFIQPQHSHQHQHQVLKTEPSQPQSSAKSSKKHSNSKNKNQSNQRDSEQKEQVKKSSYRQPNSKQLLAQQVQQIESVSSKKSLVKKPMQRNMSQKIINSNQNKDNNNPSDNSATNDTERENEIFNKLYQKGLNSMNKRDQDHRNYIQQQYKSSQPIDYPTLSSQADRTRSKSPIIQQLPQNTYSNNMMAKRDQKSPFLKKNINSASTTTLITQGNLANQQKIPAKAFNPPPPLTIIDSYQSSQQQSYNQTHYINQMQQQNEEGSDDKYLECEDRPRHQTSMKQDSLQEDSECIPPPDIIYPIKETTEDLESSNIDHLNQKQNHNLGVKANNNNTYKSNNNHLQVIKLDKTSFAEQNSFEQLNIPQNYSSFADPIYQQQQQLIQQQQFFQQQQLSQQQSQFAYQGQKTPKSILKSPSRTSFTSTGTTSFNQFQQSNTQQYPVHQSMSIANSNTQPSSIAINPKNFYQQAQQNQQSIEFPSNDTSTSNFMMTSNSNNGILNKTERSLSTSRRKKIFENDSTSSPLPNFFPESTIANSSTPASNINIYNINQQNLFTPSANGHSNTNAPPIPGQPFPSIDLNIPFNNNNKQNANSNNYQSQPPTTSTRSFSNTGQVNSLANLEQQSSSIYTQPFTANNANSNYDYNNYNASKIPKSLNQQQVKIPEINESHQDGFTARSQQAQYINQQSQNQKCNQNQYCEMPPSEISPDNNRVLKNQPIAAINTQKLIPMSKQKPMQNPALEDSKNEEMVQLNKLFNLLDENQDGIITENELDFSQLDTDLINIVTDILVSAFEDCGGQVNFDVFINSAGKTNKLAELKKATKTFFLSRVQICSRSSKKLF